MFRGPLPSVVPPSTARISRFILRKMSSFLPLPLVALSPTQTFQVVLFVFLRPFNCCVSISNTSHHDQWHVWVALDKCDTENCPRRSSQYGRATRGASLGE